MPRSADAVKLIEGALALGFSVTEAMQRALGRTLTAFAADHGFSVQAVSMCLSLYGGRVYSDVREALAADLELPREYIDRIIDSQRAEPAQAAS